MHNLIARMKIAILRAGRFLFGRTGPSIFEASARPQPLLRIDPLVIHLTEMPPSGSVGEPDQVGEYFKPL